MLSRNLLVIIALIRAAVVLAAPSILSEDQAQHPLTRPDVPVPVTLGVMSRSARFLSTIGTFRLASAFI